MEFIQAINGPLTETMSEWENIRLALNEGTIFGVPFDSAPWADAFRTHIQKRMDHLASTFTMADVRFLFLMPAEHTY